MAIGEFVVRQHGILHHAELLEVRLDILKTGLCWQTWKLGGEND